MSAGDPISMCSRTGNRGSRRRVFCLVALLVTGCQGAPDVAPLDVDDLAAGLDDPVLLTVAATRERASHIVDEGATFAADDGFAFVTDTSGDLMVGFVVDGQPVLDVGALAARAHVVTTTSDALVVALPLTADVVAELRFAAASSRVAALDVVMRNGGWFGHTVELVTALRRCTAGAPGSEPVPAEERPFFAVSASGETATLQYYTPVDVKLAVVGGGTFAEDFTGSLQVAGATRFVGLPGCAGTGVADLRSLLGELRRQDGEGAPASLAGSLGVVGTMVGVEVPGGGARLVAARRTVTALLGPGVEEPARANGRTAEDVDAALPPFPRILDAGLARLAAAPEFPADAPRGALDERSARLVFRSSFVLLDQLSLPAAGAMRHDSYVFSREPSFWFGRLGQHAHEGLVLPMWARLDPAFAVGAVMNFVERVEDDGYLPYNIGPIVTQRLLRTASAPLLCDLGRRTLDVAAERGEDVTEPRVALRDACARTLTFFARERDEDGDGLLAWGGIAISESLRDLHNPIWIEVADPELLEAVDPNAMLVVEERALATLIEQTGGSQDDADAARARAEDAVVRLQQLFVAERGGYFHRDAVDDDFEVDGRSLLRADIGGLLPLWADAAPPPARAALIAALGDVDRFGRRFGVPSMPADDASYDPTPSDCCKWDGPSWIPWNHLLVTGLLRGDDVEEHALAARIIDGSVDAVAAQLSRHHQFRESYHPDDETSANDSMPNYLWSALVAEMMLEAVGR